jgi:hypothetical protein
LHIFRPSDIFPVMICGAVRLRLLPSSAVRSAAAQLAMSSRRLSSAATSLYKYAIESEKVDMLVDTEEQEVRCIRSEMDISE